MCMCMCVNHRIQPGVLLNIPAAAAREASEQGSPGVGGGDTRLDTHTTRSAAAQRKCGRRRALRKADAREPFTTGEG